MPRGAKTSVFWSIDNSDPDRHDPVLDGAYSLRRGAREVDRPAQVGPAIVDSHGNRPAAIEIGHSYMGAQGQEKRSGGQFGGVKDLSSGSPASFVTVAIPRGHRHKITMLSNSRRRFVSA